LNEIRNDLRAKNLHDTEDGPLTGGLPARSDAEILNNRTVDGTYNDLKFPRMGSTGTRFGRNVPVSATAPDTANLLNPSPREVSLELMTRTEFQPVPFLNLLAAAWIQFETHDWFSHGRDESPDRMIEIALAPGDNWPEKPMRVPRTPDDPTRKRGAATPPTFSNRVTHWWDGSQLYGSDEAGMRKVRTGQGGRIHVGQDLKLPMDPDTRIDLTGFFDNWWMGLSLLHGLFAAEHNAICAMLKRKNPRWKDDKLYAKARLINAALMAKIHTIEWTPAILPNPITSYALKVNWSGALGGLQKIIKGLDNSELAGGIVGSQADHHGAPYSLTEEFVAVYRMHPLMPDEFEFRSARTGAAIEKLNLPEISGRANRAVLERHSMTDLFYSFGTSHPGMLRLHNFPRFLQNLARDNGKMFDMAAVDILRDRERGVPRYNQFREFLRMPRITRFADLTDNPQWAAELERVYKGDIDKVDLMVGLYAEPLPKGFGFSETAFRIFILMASRRLKSDRFFTDFYTREVYTQEGLDWIEENSMVTILKRHLPSLTDALHGVENAFNPWNNAAKKKRR